MQSGTIFNIQRFSIHDGPGIRTTVFFKGCPLRCAWCHNPESQKLAPEMLLMPARCIGCAACLAACQHGAVRQVDDRPEVDRAACQVCGACAEVCYTGARELAGRRVTASEILRELARDVAFFDESGGGVTFSGGEPLSQPTFLMALLRGCQEQEIHTVVDTSGYSSWAVLDAVRPYVRLFYYDLKLLDDERHRRYTGVSNHRILANLRRLSEAGSCVQVRVPLVPGINDADADVEALADFVVTLPGRPGISLLPYHEAGTQKYTALGKDYGLAAMRAPDSGRVGAIAERLACYDLKVTIGG